MFTSTSFHKAKTHEAHSKLSPPESREKETKVHLLVEYLSKTIRKELKDDYSVLGKAVVYGFPQKIARTVLQNETLKKFIVEQAHCSTSKWTVFQKTVSQDSILRNCAMSARKERPFFMHSRCLVPVQTRTTILSGCQCISGGIYPSQVTKFLHEWLRYNHRNSPQVRFFRGKTNDFMIWIKNHFVKLNNVKLTCC